jgi:hypothetical protein
LSSFCHQRNATQKHKKQPLHSQKDSKD